VIRLPKAMGLGHAVRFLKRMFQQLVYLWTRRNGFHLKRLNASWMPLRVFAERALRNLVKLIRKAGVTWRR